MGPTWGSPGSCRPQMGPMLAPWTMLSKMYLTFDVISVRYKEKGPSLLTAQWRFKPLVTSLKLRPSNLCLWWFRPGWNVSACDKYCLSIGWIRHPYLFPRIRQQTEGNDFCPTVFLLFFFFFFFFSFFFFLGGGGFFRYILPHNLIIKSLRVISLARE